jgi:hypothetical protein
MRANRVDSNQAPIVKALRLHGVSVQVLNAQKDGCPDLLVGWHGGCSVLEVKTLTGRLTPRQIEWHGEWKGQKAIVHSPHEAFLAIDYGTCASAGRGCEYHVR